MPPRAPAAPVVIEVPGVSSPTPGDSLPPEAEQIPPEAEMPGEPPPAPPVETDVPKRLMGEDARALLREGMANIGLGRHYGNALADWFDSQDVNVSIIGAIPDPPLVIHSHPDEPPPAEREPFGLTEE